MKYFKILLVALLLYGTGMSETLKVKKITGDAYLYSMEKEQWYQLVKDYKLDYESIIKLGKNNRLYLKSADGDPVITGPFQGKLGMLLTDDPKYTDNPMQSLFNNIPSAQQGDKKIKITFTSAAVVKGSKEKIKNKKGFYKWRSSTSDSNESEKK